MEENAVIIPVLCCISTSYQHISPVLECRLFSFRVSSLLRHLTLNNLYFFSVKLKVPTVLSFVKSFLRRFLLRFVIFA